MRLAVWIFEPYPMQAYGDAYRTGAQLDGHGSFPGIGCGEAGLRCRPPVPASLIPLIGGSNKLWDNTAHD